MFTLEETKLITSAGTVHSNMYSRTSYPISKLIIRQKHPEIKAFMAANGWGEDYTKMTQYYLTRLTTATQEITQNQIRHIVWQERKFKY